MSKVFINIALGLDGGVGAAVVGWGRQYHAGHLPDSADSGPHSCLCLAGGPAPGHGWAACLSEVLSPGVSHAATQREAGSAAPEPLGRPGHRPGGQTLSTPAGRRRDAAIGARVGTSLAPAAPADTRRRRPERRLQRAAACHLPHPADPLGSAHPGVAAAPVAVARCHVPGGHSLQLRHRAQQSDSRWNSPDAGYGGRDHRSLLEHGGTALVSDSTTPLETAKTAWTAFQGDAKVGGAMGNLTKFKRTLTINLYIALLERLLDKQGQGAPL